MALKASLVISGDAAGATAALTAANAAMDAGEAQAKKLAAAFAATDVTITKLAAAQTEAKQETDALKASFVAGDISLEIYNKGLLETKTALGLISTEHRAAVGALNQARTAMGGATVSAGQAKAGYINLGRQVQDVAVQLQGGTNIGTIIAQQGGQVADALAQMGGGFAGVAGFLAGPWGAAIIVGAGVLINTLIPALFDTGDAAEQTKGDVLDLSGGLAALTNNASIASKALADLRSSMTQTSKVADAANKATATMISAMGESARLGRQISEQQQNLTAASTLPGGLQALGPAQILTSLQKQKAAADKAVEDARKSLDEIRGLGAAQQMQDRNKAVENKAPIRSTGGGRTGSGRGGRSAANTEAARIDFGDDTERKIANIRDQFSDIPAQVAKTNQALRQLDSIASDVERKKPPNYAQITADLADARKAIEENLNKPFADYLDQANQAAQVDRLLVRGKEDEADALKVALSLQKQMGPLSEDQLQTILETVSAEKQRSRELEKQQEITGAYLEATRSIHSEIEAILSGQGKLGNFKQIFAQLRGKLLTESIFGDAFRDLESYIKGENPLNKATGDFTASTKRSGDALDKLTLAFTAAGGTIKAAADKAAGVGAAGAPAGDPTRPASGSSGSSPSAADDAIIVMGKRLTSTSYADQLGTRIASSLSNSLDTLFHSSVFTKLTPQIAGAVSGYATGGIPGSVIGLAKTIKGLPQGLSDILGKAGAGAGTGSAVAGIGKSLGIKLSTTGSQVGGALGSLIPIPGGDIIGSIVGGLLGKLFGGHKTGSAIIGSTDGALAVTGTSGKTSAFKTAASTDASSVVDAVAKIADALGGSIDASLGHVSIGIRDGKYRVDPTGSGVTKTKKGAVDFGKDGEAAAISYAIADLVKDGVVTGVSAAVKKALTSSTDVDKAVAEAQKVQDLELALGGVGGALSKAFKDFERTAADRLRIAKQYGFDVVAVEKKNADDRLALSKQLLEQQVGSIQSLVTELTSGSLFEGSAVDLRNSLLSQITAAKADADAGKDGAADTLSALLENFVAASKDAYATTGTYAADRASVLDQARDTIAKANQRIADAQATTSDPALATTNATLDENNDQNAQIIAQLGTQSTLLAQIAAASSATGGLDFTRLINLAGVQLQ